MRTRQRKSSAVGGRRRTLSSGQVHIRSSFNNTMVTVTDTQGNATVLGFLRRTGFPRQQEVHSLRGSDRSRDGCPAPLWSMA